MIKKIKFSFFLLPFFLFGCKTSRVTIHGKQEFISLKILDSDKYRYLYYNFGDTAVVYNFNFGRFSKDDNHYRLFPEPVNPEQFPFSDVKTSTGTFTNGIKITVSTDISGDDSDKYVIHLISAGNDVITYGAKLDTVLTSFKEKALKIRIDLPVKLSKGMGNQLPTFTTVLTQEIAINTENHELNVHIPVSFSTFYYKYEKEIDLKEAGAYWEWNGRKILMRNLDF